VQPLVPTLVSWHAAQAGSLTYGSTAAVPADPDSCATPSVARLYCCCCAALQGGKDESRSVRVPPHRYTPLKESWEAIVKPVVDHMKLQIRMNTKTRSVEIKVRRAAGPGTAGRQS